MVRLADIYLDTSRIVKHALGNECFLPVVPDKQENFAFWGDKRVQVKHVACLIATCLTFMFDIDISGTAEYLSK